MNEFKAGQTSMKRVMLTRTVLRSLYVLIGFHFFMGLQANADDTKMKNLLGDITKMYMSSMVYIFQNQPLINQPEGDKTKLFGKPFIDNLKQIYHAKYNEAFPTVDHFAKKMLLQAMVEVMDDNKELLYDPDIGFKGVIPATFASQLSARLAAKGVGLKIKFTRTEGSIRNILNLPDPWESSMMHKIIKNPKIYYDENALLNGKPAIRQFTPLPMAPYCLSCHGTPDKNILNIGKVKSQWSNIDITGFEMENWTIDDFGGGISISIEKSVLK
jgi:hypothetical protein